MFSIIAGFGSHLSEISYTLLRTIARNSIVMMNNQQLQERRENSRSRCLKGARIVLANGNSTLACRVRNQSENGFRLLADQTSYVPRSFTLVMDGDTRGKACTVTWRSASEMGAVITSDAETVPHGYNQSTPLMRKIKHEAVDRYPV